MCILSVIDQKTLVNGHVVDNDHLSGCDSSRCRLTEDRSRVRSRRSSCPSSPLSLSYSHRRREER